MTRVEKLEKIVRELYGTKDLNRADWADWLINNHVLIVADYANSLSQKYGGNAELAMVAALLHDIADVNTKRDDENHEQKSIDIARNIMQQVGYDKQEITLVIEDAIGNHSCHNGEQPKTIEGKILSTADALAHLKTDFYIFAMWALDNKLSFEDRKKWVLKKIDRDINEKICFDDIRNDTMNDYTLLKNLFSRL